MSDAAICRERLKGMLRVPVMVAPMFLVSGPELVLASARAGAVGAFPTLNARTPAELDHWLGYITGNLGNSESFAANLILHASNERRETDLEILERHQVPVVVASVGSPAGIADRVHAWGGLVLSDVASVRHARKAVAAGADGLVLLTGGAGGNTGWLNPFAFLSAVRGFYDGFVAVAGCVSNGRELHALRLLGADAAYMGTAFLACKESLAPEEHKLAVIASSADDIVLTDAISGLPANFIRSRLVDTGLMDDDGRLAENLTPEVYSYKTVWSAGQGVGAVTDTEPAEAVIRRLDAEYRLSLSRSV